MQRIGGALPGWAVYAIRSSTVKCKLPVAGKPLATVAREYDYPHTGARILKQVDAVIIVFPTASLARSWIETVVSPRSRVCSRQAIQHFYQQTNVGSNVRAFVVPGIPSWLSTPHVRSLRGFSVMLSVGPYRSTITKALFQDPRDGRIAYSMVFHAFRGDERTIARLVVGLGRTRP